MASCFATNNLNARRLVVGVLIAVCAVLACAGCRTAAPGHGTAAGDPEQQARFVKLNARLRASEPEMRQQAAVALLTMGYPGAAGAVLDALVNDPDPAVRVSMIRAAAFCADERCFPAVLRALDDRDPSVPPAAAEAIARFTQPAQLDAVAALVRRPTTSAAQRELLFRALGEAIAVRAVPVLIAGLEDPNQGPRDAAWESLKRISGRDLPADVPIWSEWWSANAHLSREDVLEDHLRTATHELAESRERVAWFEEQQGELISLLGDGEAQTPERLIQALASSHVSVRICAAVSLAAMPQERLGSFTAADATRGTLRRAMADQSEVVRWNVLKFAVKTTGPLRDEIVAAALADESPRVLQTALGAVRQGAAPAAVRRIEALLLECDRADVREAAAAALGQLGDPASADALMAGLSDPAENVRWFAIEGLGKLGATQAVPRIAEMLAEDESRIVRAVAAATLGDLGQPAAIPPLRAALQDPQQRVRENAVAALKALATGSSERMMVIARALEQQGLLNDSREVLTRLVNEFAADAAAESAVVEAYERLADIAGRQEDVAAAARAYAKLIDLSPGTAEYRAGLVACRLKLGEGERLATELAGWLQGADAARRTVLLPVALDAAEALLASGGRTEAKQILDAVAAAAVAGTDEAIVARLDDLRAKAG
jgi:HEAT repeat protein